MGALFEELKSAAYLLRIGAERGSRRHLESQGCAARKAERFGDSAFAP